VGGVFDITADGDEFGDDAYGNFLG
jgi:hypothetical protein